MAPTSASAPLRLFFALWPDDTVRAALAALTVELHERCGGRAMAATNLHATLAFLGNVPHERVADFVAMADALRAEPFDLPLDTLNYWRRNRIVWAGARNVPAALAALADEMKCGVQGLGWPVDERPYAAHVTLLRDARRGPPAHEVRLPLWRVTDFVLVASTQQSGGVVYEPLRRWTLRAQPV